MRLFEKYRPRSLDDVVGQEAAVAAVRRILKGGWGGRAWLVTGPSGSGKTTLARIIAAIGADPLAIHEHDAQDVTLDFLRDMEDAFRCRALGERSGKAWIFNEVHGLRGPIVSRMLTLLEGGKNFDTIPDHVAILLTSTKNPTDESGQGVLFEDCDDGGPFISRCHEIRLAHGAEVDRAFALRAKAIAQAEGVDGLPDLVYNRALSACRSNFRQLLQKIESGTFRTDAKKYLEHELSILASTKGDRAAAKRAEIEAAVASL